MGRPVIDRTGLKGRYDVDLNATLNWDHLSFKLESTRVAVETIVIDSVQRAAEN